MKDAKRRMRDTGQRIGDALGAVNAAGAEVEIIDFAFPHEGPFGSYDTLQLQRGLADVTDGLFTAPVPM